MSTKEKIVSAEITLEEQKLKIGKLKENQENEIRAAKQAYDLKIREIENVYKQDSIDVNELRLSIEEKRKKNILKADIEHKETLEKIEEKY